MDWQNKFYSIIRETDENLAKAKVKLANKSAGFVSSQRDPNLPQHAVRTQVFSQSFGGDPAFLRYLQPEAPYSIQREDFNMSAASSIQVLHMQEQIDAQNKTIDQLQKLVRSLDSERDFYKQQISHLKGEVDGLSEKMGHRMSLVGGERQMSRIKQEVIREIEKVKTMLHNQTRESRVGRSHFSPRLDDELWNVKENLSESLEHIRRELGLMNKRIDRMESGLSSDSTRKHTQDFLHRSFNTDHYPRVPSKSQPSSYTHTFDTSVDAHQIRSTVNLLNAKLDSLERKIDVASRPIPDFYTPNKTSAPYVPLSAPSQPFLQPSFDEDDEVENLSDLSALSDLSNLSDNDDDGDDDDIDAEIDAIIKRSSSRADKRYKSGSYTTEKSSIYKTGSRKKGKVEFDLSDLDLSDAEDVDVDLETLDL